MNRRYKIIAQKEGIKITHYELWVEYKVLWFGRWRAVTESEFHFDGMSKNVPHKFKDLNDVKNYIHSLTITREVVEEGVFE